MAPGVVSGDVRMPGGEKLALNHTVSITLPVSIPQGFQHGDICGRYCWICFRKVSFEFGDHPEVCWSGFLPAEKSRLHVSLLSFMLGDIMLVACKRPRREDLLQGNQSTVCTMVFSFFSPCKHTLKTHYWKYSFKRKKEIPSQEPAACAIKIFIPPSLSFCKLPLLKGSKTNSNYTTSFNGLSFFTVLITRLPLVRTIW